MVEAQPSERAKIIICQAVNQGKIDPVVGIINQGLVQLNEPVQDGDITVLMLVAGKGSAEDIQKILDLGPEVNKPDKYGRTALHFACRSGNMETFSKLVDLEDMEYDVFTKAGVTPLMMAVESRNINLIAECLRSNFNPFLQNGLNQTALDYARFGHEKIDNDIVVILEKA